MICMVNFTNPTLWDSSANIPTGRKRVETAGLEQEDGKDGTVGTGR